MAIERVKRLNKRQRMAQAAAASDNIVKEAQRIAGEKSIDYETALAQVFADPELLKRLHAIVAPVEQYPKDWKPQ